MRPITNKYQVSLFIPGGRTSTTGIYDSTNRILKQIRNGKKCKILYFGDHDPCGLDMMIRDIPKRLNLFTNDIELIPIALTMKQIDKYKLPTDQITKEKDTNKEWYVRHTKTNKCWEIDAIKPNILQKIIENNILKYLDVKDFNKIIEEEKVEIDKLKSIYKI